jgi:hypothetical protein
MKNDSSRPEPANPRSRLALVALSAVATMLFACLCGTASAQRNPLVGRDGKIHACYRVKGKPRGALRVVRSPRAHCRRGERKVAWTVAGAEGTAGSTGAAGAPGGQGGDGTQGAITTTLTEQVKSLSARIDGLEATLAGVCEQSEALTEQVNLVAEVVKGLGLNGVLKTLGGLLEIPELPKPLGTFTCPSF